MVSGTVFRAGGLGFGVTLVVAWSFVCTGVARSLDMVYGMTFSSIFTTWLFTYMTVNDHV